MGLACVELWIAGKLIDLSIASANAVCLLPSCATSFALHFTATIPRTWPKSVRRSRVKSDVRLLCHASSITPAAMAISPRPPLSQATSVGNALATLRTLPGSKGGAGGVDGGEGWQQTTPS